MATISNNNIAEAIYSITEGKTHVEQSSIFPKIVQFLSKRRLLSKTDDILVRLNKIINDKEGKVVAKVSSVQKINEKNKKELLHNLSERYLGKKVMLEENLDNNLLGGLRIEVNDEVIDFTLKNRIRKLQEHLTSTHE